MAVPQNTYRAVVGQTDRPNIIFIRLKSINMVVTLREIYTSIASLCWISNLPNLSIGIETSLRVRADGTINALGDIFRANPNSAISGNIGEYVISEMARSTLVNEMGYLDIPLGEIIKQQITGNSGFDFYSMNDNQVILFGEAKFVAGRNAYGNAMSQIDDFINEKRDESDLYDLQPFCPPPAIDDVVRGRKGFVAAFSATNTPSSTIIHGIQQNRHFANISGYDELICVAITI